MNTFTIKARLRAFNYILIAEDDKDDQELILDALLETELDAKKVKFVNDGEELLMKLNSSVILPSIILLDLNMPKKNGLQALSEIRATQRFKHLPVIMFTTSDAYTDIRRCHELGSNSFMTKPHQYSALVDSMQTLISYWIGQAQIITD